MKGILTKYQIDAVWHFTDKSNWGSIENQNGLLSLSELERRGVRIPAPGGNDWSHDADRIKGVDQYVHLSFIDNHPMLFRAKEEGRIPNPVWIKIKSEIILEDGVRFCSSVSNKHGVPLLDAEQAKKQIDFEALFKFLDWTIKENHDRRTAAEKSEILVPKLIPISNIIEVKNG